MNSFRMTLWSRCLNYYYFMDEENETPRYKVTCSIIEKVSVITGTLSTVVLEFLLYKNYHKMCLNPQASSFYSSSRGGSSCFLLYQSSYLFSHYNLVSSSHKLYWCPPNYGHQFSPLLAPASKLSSYNHLGTQHTKLLSQLPGPTHHREKWRIIDNNYNMNEASASG